MVAGYAHIYAEEKRCGIEAFLNMPRHVQDMNIAHLDILGERRKREADKMALQARR